MRGNASPGSPRPPRSFGRDFWTGSVDLRPAGLFRIVFGVATLGSILDLQPILATAFSDEGFWPREALLSAGVPAARIGIMDLAGPPWVADAYWLAVVAACVCFIVGWHTRLANVVLFALFFGLMERDALPFNGSDEVIRTLLFWSMFVPLGRRYSLDAVRADACGRPLSEHGRALPVRVVQLQLCWVYLCAFLRKLPGKTWHDGTAVHYALGLDIDFTRALGHLLDRSPTAIAGATYFTVVVEAAFLPLVFLPVVQPRAKLVALGAGFALHAGILATMCLGAFPWVMIAAYPILFETEWAAWIVRRCGALCGRGVSRVIVDPACAGCARRVARIRAFDADESVAIDGVPRDALDESHRLRVVDPTGKVREDWEAALHLAGRMPALAPLALVARLPVVRGLSRKLLLWAAEQERELHRQPSSPPETRIDWSERLAATAPLRILRAGRDTMEIALLASCVWISAPDMFGRPVPNWLGGLIRASGITQTWNLFTPDPSNLDVWLRGAGKLADGKQVDVLRGDESGGPLPPARHGIIASRWAAIAYDVATGNELMLLEFGRYLCRHWNADRPSARALLETFQLYRVERTVLPTGHAPTPWHEVRIWSHQCFDPPPSPAPSSSR